MLEIWLKVETSKKVEISFFEISELLEIIEKSLIIEISMILEIFDKQIKFFCC